MERQFRQRIHRDHKFLLRELTDTEVLAVYRRRIQLWLGAALPEVRGLLDDPRFTYLPFCADDIVAYCRMKTLRECLDEMDRHFRAEMGIVTINDPRKEYLIARNDFRIEEGNSAAFAYTKDHLGHITELMTRAGGFFAGAFGMSFSGLDAIASEDELPGLRLEFRDLKLNDRWVRVFVIRLAAHYNQKLSGCINMIRGLHTDRNFLWLVRPEKVDKVWETLKADQVFARKLETSCETTLRAMLRLLEKRDYFDTETWAKAEQVLLEEFKLTYLGELFQHVADNLLEVS
jgi:hypothetical protein